LITRKYRFSVIYLCVTRPDRRKVILTHKHGAFISDVLLFVSAAFVSLRSIIIVELLGIEKLTNSFGLVVLAQGLSTFVGSPIAGTGLASLVTYVIQVPSWLHL